MATPPRFVNLQAAPVGVYSPEKRKVYIAPFADRLFPHDKKTTVFVVEGEHYRQFVAPAGPLSYFPETAENAPVVAEPQVGGGSVDSAKPSDAAGDSETPAGDAPAGSSAPAGDLADAAKTPGDAAPAGSTNPGSDAAGANKANPVTPKATTTPKAVVPPQKRK